ncbi:putative bifunctional diguanylate cyclase/phosphodiesterase [Oceanimonas marisflavi]|uniref:putative bifunctional diguanylate cyclase/phosphodiesterase n=1 Tax=Oceanimonas marisflavi TaxID=2059724 RepID=UPI000D311ECE|nr:EAL domain-containing protein [Oceanimonas marisflavi]
MLISVIQQAIILLAMSWVLTLNVRKGWYHPRLLVVASGFWFGLAAIVCMLFPFTVAPGVLLDMRDGVLFVAGLFGGPVAGALATLLAGAFRFWVGGDGAPSGVFNMILALTLGLGFRHGISRGWWQLRPLHLLPVVVLIYATGLIWLAMLITPAERVMMPDFSWPYLLVGVPLTLGLAQILKDAEQRQYNETDLRIAAVAFEGFDGILVTDAQNRILRVNRAFTDITGYSAEEVIGKTPALFSSGQHDAAFYRQMWHSIREQDHWQGEICNRRKSGQLYHQWMSISAVRNEQGKISHYVASMSDITQRKEDAERINHLAFYDGVTGLPNRRQLNECIRQYQISESNAGAGLVFIDLDNFKHINDLWGLQTGDELLTQVAQRLQQSLREQDMVARLGGDEFVVLLTGLPADRTRAAARLEHTSQRLLALLEKPYTHEGRVLRCGASMGLVLLENRELSPAELVQQAELAMYEAKKSGKGKLRFFDPHMQEAVAQRLRLEEDIVRGLEAEEFQPYFQPQFDYRGNMIGAEALARWHHPERGILAPGAFIEVASAAGLMNRIDRMILACACRQMAAWARLSVFRDFSLSVNIGATRLYQPGFIEDVLGIFEQTGVDPACIKLEITESMLLNDISTAIERMHILKQHGVRFAIDDFGTGYSSLLYLQKLPLDQLKIDQSFVSVLPDDGNSLNIIKAIVAMARSLKLEVIAEGVETDAQRQLLHQHGCQLYQGYLLARPEPASSVEAMFEHGAQAASLH